MLLQSRISGNSNDFRRQGILKCELLTLSSEETEESKGVCGSTCNEKSRYLLKQESPGIVRTC